MNHLSSSSSSRLLRLLVGVGLITIIGCQSSPPETTSPPEKAEPPRPAKTSAELSNEFTATAEVTAVDRERRRVTLRRADGKLVTLLVGQAARNFDQIAIGDEVRVRYKESLTASVRPAGETALPAQGVVGVARTAAGAKPGGGVGLAVSVRVKIESIDVERNLIVFSLASGELISHRLATAEGREFARSLVVGSVVQLDYAEALALSVDKL